MSVVIGARRQAKLADLCAAIRSSGGKAELAVTDMCREDQVERLVATAIERFGRLDALVNNAAMGTLRTVAEGRTDEWRQTLETNVIGTLVACRAALRHMLPQGSGTILNVTSASAHEAWPYLAVYAASKAAVHTLSDGLRAEVAGSGVRVMTIEVHNVGGTDFASTFDPAILPEAIQRWIDLGLLSRESPMIAAEDIARAIAFQLEQPDPVSVHHLSVRSRAN
jgi:NADP-dependent 3-hydroxy acid dehydrogenase YdfG